MQFFWIIYYVSVIAIVAWRLRKGTYRQKQHLSNHLSFLLTSYIFLYVFTKLPAYLYIITFIITLLLTVDVIRRLNKAGS